MLLSHCEPKREFAIISKSLKSQIAIGLSLLCRTNGDPRPRDELNEFSRVLCHAREAAAAQGASVAAIDRSRTNRSRPTSQPVQPSDQPTDRPTNQLSQNRPTTSGNHRRRLGFDGGARQQQQLPIVGVANLLSRGYAVALFLPRFIPRRRPRSPREIFSYVRGRKGRVTRHVPRVATATLYLSLVFDGRREGGSSAGRSRNRRAVARRVLLLRSREGEIESLVRRYDLTSD